jgi:DNA-binding transcriptional MerR regulator
MHVVVEDSEGYSIQQLAEKAGVSVRTIRFYIDEGLLAAPPVKGRYTVYSDEYVDRLEMIRRLKDMFLPLKEIRERVTSLSWSEVKLALKQNTRQEKRLQISEQSGSALNYISELLSAPTAPSRLVAPPAASAQPEAWERLTLAPGIELHIRSDASSANQRLAHQVIDYARKLFNTSHKGGF